MFNKKRIMTRAWNIAWHAYFEFGRVGSAKEYFSGALKMAWAEVKEREAKRRAAEKARVETLAFLSANAGDYEAILEYVKTLTHNGKITGGTVVERRTERDMYGNICDVHHIEFGESAEKVARILAEIKTIESFSIDFMTPEQEAERKAQNESFRRAVRYNAEQIRQNVYDNF